MGAFDERKVWPRLFTCPAWTDENLREDDLGERLFNPVFSNKGKMLRSCDGCLDCDMKDECPGPVAYKCGE